MLPSIVSIPTGSETHLAHYTESRAREPLPGNMREVYSMIPAFSRQKLSMFYSGSWLPGQFGLVDFLAMYVFENLADEVRLMGLDECDDLHGPAAFGAE